MQDEDFGIILNLARAHIVNPRRKQFTLEQEQAITRVYNRVLRAYKEAVLNG